METKQILISQYNYNLPDARIAKHPLPRRDNSKLLVYRRGEIAEDTFSALPHYLPKGALMIFNNTRVIQARLRFQKETGAWIEVFVLEPACPAEYQENFLSRNSCEWFCLVGNLKRWKEGVLRHEVEVNGQSVCLCAERIEDAGESHRVAFSWNGDFTWAEILEALGELPIPPYLNRATEESDKQTYQTVYGRIDGSVAAPTAGLHFTPEVMATIDAMQVERQEVTLHVGAGTFKPVKSEAIGQHDMHAEHIEVPRSVIERLIAHQGEAIAVGTTSVRTLESLYYIGILALQGKTQLHVPQWMPYDEHLPQLSTIESLVALRDYMQAHELETLHATTQIIIAPGYTYHIVKMMVTNFHQPQSTLLLLVSAFVGDNWRQIYQYALSHDFRFLSYGDSSLLVPQ